MTLIKVPLKAVGTPWGGVVSDVPPPGGLAVFDDMRNFLCRKGRISTRPALGAYGAPPDGARVRYMGTFLDAVNMYHTLVLTTQNAYMITAGPVYNSVGSGLDGTALPYGVVTLLNRVYFANGSVALKFSDGSNAITTAGNVPGSARFLTVNAQSLISAYTTEPALGIVNSTEFPQRVRWSASGLPDQWDEIVDPSAGFNDLVEVPDVVTGLTTMGRNSYIFRSNGISVMYPTGNSGVGSLAFAFEDFSFAPLGIGNDLPYSLATYGPRCVFVAKDDIYLFDGSTPIPIGYGNKKKIFADLAAASGDVVTGGILPVIGPSFDFLAYYLSIPGPNVAWVFGYDEKNWMRIDSAAGFLTAFNYVSVGA